MINQTTYERVKNVGKIDESTKKDFYKKILNSSVECLEDANYPGEAYVFITAKDNSSNEHLYICKAGSVVYSDYYQLSMMAQKFSIYEKEIKEEEWREFSELYEESVIYDRDEKRRNKLASYYEKFGGKHIIKMYGHYWFYDERVSIEEFVGTRLERYYEKGIKHPNLSDTALHSLDGECPVFYNMVIEHDSLEALSKGICPLEKRMIEEGKIDDLDNLPEEILSNEAKNLLKEKRAADEEESKEKLAYVVSKGKLSEISRARSQFKKENQR